MSGPLSIKRVVSRAPAWLIPLAILAAVGLLLSLLTYRLSGGMEIADDARTLSKFARNPFILWGDYRKAGLSDTWGSFPPLMPLLYGLLVYPWLSLLPDFLGIRAGILTWSAVALLALHFTLDRAISFPEERKRSTLTIFALLPSVIGAISFIPQEEIYVSLFVLALYVAAVRGKWKLIPFLLVLTLLAGKYFILILIVPLALFSGKPVKNALGWAAACTGLLVVYIGYHEIFFGLRPILGHVLDPGSSLSIWAALWNAGIKYPPHVIRSVSIVATAAFTILFCWNARRKGLPLVFAMAGTLYITLLTISITFPAYILWNVPIMLICAGRMDHRRRRLWVYLLLVVWGAGEWGANFFRGVALTFQVDRSAGKTVIGSLAENILGRDFPFNEFHLACILLVIASGIAQLYLLWVEGKKHIVKEVGR